MTQLVKVTNKADSRTASLSLRLQTAWTRIRWGGPHPLAVALERSTTELAMIQALLIEAEIEISPDEGGLVGAIQRLICDAKATRQSQTEVEFFRAEIQRENNFLDDFSISASDEGSGP